MQNFFKYFLLLIIFIIISLVFYYIFMSIKNSKAYQKNSKIKKWQKERLKRLLQERILNIQKNGKSINQDEKEVLTNFVNNMDDINSWNEIDKIANDYRIYSFINVAIMDNLYLSDIDTTNSKNEFLQNLFILDCVNGGVKFAGKKPICYPENIDIKKTIQLIINNQEELTTTQSEILTSYVSNKWNEYSPETFEKFKKEHLENHFSSLISDSAIDKTLEELANKKYVKDLSNPARYVISKVIIEILSNIIYSGNDYKKLSENTKIYSRILASVVANEPYEIIFSKFQ